MITLKQLKENLKRNRGLYSYLLDKEVLIELEQAIRRFKEKNNESKMRAPWDAW